MEIEIPYDGKILSIDFPESTHILEAGTFPCLGSDDIRGVITSAWEQFRGRFIDKKILIVVNDATRRVPNGRIIEILTDIIPIEHLEIIIATGTHKAPSVDELQLILGDQFEGFRDKIHIHDCYDKSDMVDIGKTGRDTEVSLNRKLISAEAVICINSVEPHFFAGFTGGRKSLVPGLASFETTVANHSHAKSVFAESMNLNNNPVHLDLQEAVGLMDEKPVFSIQLVLSRSGEIVDLFCGELRSSFEEACQKSKEVYSVPVQEYFDLLFAIGEPPLDANLYQLQKAQEHGARVVADGGILVVVGACQDGAGSPYFVNLADEYRSPEDALSDRAMNDNRFGIHKLIKTARRLKKIKIRYVTKVDDNIIRKLYFEPRKNVQEALREGLDLLGDSCRIGVLKDACFMVPERV